MVVHPCAISDVLSGETSCCKSCRNRACGKCGCCVCVDGHPRGRGGRPPDSSDNRTYFALCSVAGTGKWSARFLQTLLEGGGIRSSGSLAWSPGREEQTCSRRRES